MVLRARRGPALVAVALSALVALVLLLGARTAHAWVDTHVEGDEIRLTLDRSGVARVEHRITLKIAGGPLRSLDLRGVDGDAAPEPEAYVVPQKEASKSSLSAAAPVTLELIPPGSKPEADGSTPAPILRVRFQNKGIGRGVYVLLVRYSTNLADRITRDGAMARITWRGPVWDDGLDAGRLTFDLPAAPSEPRADDAPGPQGATTAEISKPLVLSSLKRSAARDSLELMRPYIPKGESVLWSIHADLHVARVTSPDVIPLPAPRASSSIPFEEPTSRALALVVAGAIFVLYSLVVALKAAEVARDTKAAGIAPRPLFPIPIPLRAALAGLALVAGLAVELVVGRATLGALLVLLATGLAAHLTPRWDPRKHLRGPGRWLPVTEADALRDPPQTKGGRLDVSTRAGKVLFACTLLALAAGVWALNDVSPDRAKLLAFDVPAILALFCTGRRRELPPVAETPARFLRDIARLARRGAKGLDLRILGRIRVPEGSADPDEIRLGLAPRRPLAGFTSIEIGVVYVPGAGGAIGLPEVLLRVAEGSPCDEAIARLEKAGRVTGGRRAGERVIAFSPRLPTARMTASLALGLVRTVTKTAQNETARAPEPAIPERQVA